MSRPSHEVAGRRDGVAHPVPPSAARFPHVAAYFAARGTAHVDAKNTGRTVAWSLTSHLLPWAQAAVGAPRS